MLSDKPDPPVAVIQGASTATVRIYLSGVLRFEGIRPLAGSGAGWEVAAIDWLPAA